MDLAALKRLVVSGFAWQGATKLIAQACSWASTIFVARLVAPEAYGIVAAAAVMTQLLLLLAEFGVAQGLVQKKNLSRQAEDGIFYLSILFGLAAYGVLFLLAPAIAGFYRMPELEPVLHLLGFMVIFGTVKTVPTALAMRQMNFRYVSLAEMAGSIAMTITVISLALQGFGVWSLVWGPIVSQLLMMLILLPQLGRWPRPGIASAEVREILGFGLKVTGTQLLYLIWSKADVTIIGRVLGERMLGLYSMAFQIAVLPLDKVGTIFGQVLFPAMARLQDNPQASRQLFLKLHGYLLLITYPLLFGLAATAHDFVELLLSPPWLPIVPLLQALCLISALRISGMLMPPVLFARGQVGYMVRYSTLCALVLPAAFLIGARYGLGGVVAAWAIAYPCLYAVLARFCLRELGLSWGGLLHSALPAAAATATMLTAVFGFSTGIGQELELAGRFFSSVGVGAAAYIGCIILLFPGQFHEFKQRLTQLWAART